MRFTLDEQPEKATADEPDHSMWARPAELAIVEPEAAAEPAKDAAQADASQDPAQA